MTTNTQDSQTNQQPQPTTSTEENVGENNSALGYGDAPTGEDHPSDTNNQ